MASPPAARNRTTAGTPSRSAVSNWVISASRIGRRGKRSASGCHPGSEIELPTQSRSTSTGPRNATELEDDLYNRLAKEHEFNDPRWPFVIKVRDVQDKALIDATFKHRVKGKDEFDLVIQAKKAVLHVDPAQRSSTSSSMMPRSSITATGRTSC